MEQNNIDPVVAPEAVPAIAAPARQSPAKAFNRAVADVKQNVAAVTTATTEAVTASSEKAINGARTLAAFNKDTLSAFVQANQIAIAGSQDLFRQAAQASKVAFDETVAGFRALASVKSVKDGIELQANLARASFDRALNEGNRFAHASLALAEKASAPLTARAVIAAQTLTARAA